MIPSALRGGPETGLRERRSSRVAEWLAWAVLIGACAWFVVQRGAVDLKRPVPWPDEGSFLWQTLAFRDRWTLFAPELNPTRHVLWMPPGFMVLEGALFKIVPFSLGASRSLSALFVCGAFACVLSMARGFRTVLGISVIAVMFLFAPIVVVVGNVARMESLVLLMSALAFLLLSSGRIAGLAVLLLLPLVHPNGLFPLVGGVFYFVGTARERRVTAAADRAAFAVFALFALFAVAALAWIAYGVYVGTHFDAFVRDIGSQLRFKAFISSEDGGPSARVRLPILVVPALLLAASVAVARRLETRTYAIATLAAVLLVQSVVTAGWLYDVYAVFAILLATIVVVETAAAALERSTLRPSSRLAALVALCLTTSLLAERVVRAPFLQRSLVRSTVDREGLAPPYFERSDYDAVAAYLTSVAKEQGSLSVQFIPDGEALLFEKLRGPRLGFVQQTFYVGFFDVAIVHESVWVPKFVHNLEILNVFSMHRTPPEETTLVSRDGTERFLAFRWKREPQH